MKNLHNHHRWSYWRTFTPVVQSPTHFLQPQHWPLQPLFLYPILTFLSQVSGGLFPLIQAIPCMSVGSFLFVWSQESCQSQLSSHHQNGFWMQIHRWHQMWSYTFLATFPWNSVLGTVAFPEWKTSMAICFHWSSVLVMDFWVRTVTVLFLMAADI